MKGQIELMHGSLLSSLSGLFPHTSEVPGHLEEFFFTTQPNCWFLIQEEKAELKQLFPKTKKFCSVFGTISNVFAKIQDTMSSMKLEMIRLQPL